MYLRGGGQIPNLAFCTAIIAETQCSHVFVPSIPAHKYFLSKQTNKQPQFISH